MIYRFIQQYWKEFAVAVMCRVLGIRRSRYYAWQSRPTSQRERAISHPVKEIRAVHAKSRQTYGCPRVFAELRTNQVVCGRRRVARLMRQHGIVSQRRFKITTNSQHTYPVAPNLMQQQFVAEQSNQTWLADITCVPTNQGWLYLAAVLDLYSRPIVGWAMQPHLTSELGHDRRRSHRPRRRAAAQGCRHSGDRDADHLLAKYERSVAEAIRRDMADCEFLDLCDAQSQADGKPRWTLSLAKVPQPLQAGRRCALRTTIAGAEWLLDWRDGKRSVQKNGLHSLLRP